MESEDARVDAVAAQSRDVCRTDGTDGPCTTGPSHAAATERDAHRRRVGLVASRTCRGSQPSPSSCFCFPSSEDMRPLRPTRNLRTRRHPTLLRPFPPATHRPTPSTPGWRKRGWRRSLSLEPRPSSNSSPVRWWPNSNPPRTARSLRTERAAASNRRAGRASVMSARSRSTSRRKTAPSRQRVRTSRRAGPSRSSTTPPSTRSAASPPGSTRVRMRPVRTPSPQNCRPTRSKSAERGSQVWRYPCRASPCTSSPHS